jgi:hypothetical protein
MKAFLLVALLVGAFGPRSSVGAPKPLHQRSWLGGEYKLAKRPMMFQSRDIVRAFPNYLRDQQHGGILITALETNTPAAMSGLRPGDLVLKVNDQPVEKLGTFFKFISAGQPGQVVQLSAYRDGEILDFPVTLGRETYQKEGTIALGLLFSGDWDPLPKPEFSLIALGYKRRLQRLELYSPETRYRMHVASGGAPMDGAGAARGITSSEGWEAWCVILSVSSRKRILSQETIPNHPAETAFASLSIR